AAVPADAHALIGLHASALAFLHLDVDDHGVTGGEIGNGPAGGELFALLVFERLNEVHNLRLHRRRSPKGALISLIQLKFPTGGRHPARTGATVQRAPIRQSEGFVTRLSPVRSGFAAA